MKQLIFFVKLIVTLKSSSWRIHPVYRINAIKSQRYHENLRIISKMRESRVLFFHVFPSIALFTVTFQLLLHKRTEREGEVEIRRDSLELGDACTGK